jgi:glucosamine-6-phosphate deaminase
MLLILKRGPQEVTQHAARFIATAIRGNPSITLGMATGSTVIGVYKELVRMHREENLDFSRVTTFNLDEYFGLTPHHPESFRYFMEKHLFSGVNISPKNIHIPDGTIRGDFDKYCASYEQSIRDAGGIDLQLLGIGRNGHIAFNEPTSSLGSRTRLKVLRSETIEDNRKLFAPEEQVPECAITMGIGTILEARRILLLASGETKAAIIAQAVEGPVTASVGASALQWHPNVTYIVDEAAASQLAQREYYERVLKMTELLTPERLG